MARHALILLLLISGSTHAMDWNAPDKQKHMKVSIAIAGLTQLATEDWKTSLALCGAAGLAKEVYDEVSYGGFSHEDLIADAAGCLTGVLLGDTALKGLSWDGSRGIQYTIRF